MKRFTGCGHDADIGVEVGVQPFHQPFKTIEYTEHDDECSASDSYGGDADPCNHIDRIHRFFRAEIAPGEKKVQCAERILLSIQIIQPSVDHSAAGGCPLPSGFFSSSIFLKISSILKT